MIDISRPPIARMESKWLSRQAEPSKSLDEATHRSQNFLRDQFTLVRREAAAVKGIKVDIVARGNNFILDFFSLEVLMVAVDK